MKKKRVFSRGGVGGGGGGFCYSAFQPTLIVAILMHAEGDFSKSFGLVL